MQKKITKPNEVKTNCAKIKIVYQNLYEKYFFNILNEKLHSGSSAGRFEVYTKVKKHYKFEKYLLYLKNDLRRNITNVRISTSNLPIETLRKANVKREDRICPLCKNGEICTEQHVIMYCTSDVILNLRKELDAKLTAVKNQWQYLSKNDKFVYLVLANDKDFNFYFSIFLDKVFREFKKKM